MFDNGSNSLLKSEDAFLLSQIYDQRPQGVARTHFICLIIRSFLFWAGQYIIDLVVETMINAKFVLELDNQSM